MFYSALMMELISEAEQRAAEHVSPHRIEAIRERSIHTRHGVRHAVASALVRAGVLLDASAGPTVDAGRGRAASVTR